MSRETEIVNTLIEAEKTTVGVEFALTSAATPIPITYSDPHVLDVRLVNGKIEVLRAMEKKNTRGQTIEVTYIWQPGGTT